MLGKEKIEHIKIAEWLKQCTNIPFLHIANERMTSAQHHKLLKRMGVRAGVSDFFFPRSNNYYKGLWLELKSLDGKPSQMQTEFINDMLDEGYYATFAYGASEAILIIKYFYSIK